MFLLLQKLDLKSRIGGALGIFVVGLNPPVVREECDQLFVCCLPQLAVRAYICAPA